MSDTKTINTTIEALLSQWGIKYEINLIGDACPPFCKDADKPGIGTFPRRTHIHGRNYRLTLSTGQVPRAKYIAVDFWNSYHDAEVAAIGTDPNRPTTRKTAKVLVADVLSCAQLDDPCRFEDWCAEYGYDSDSRKAEAIWRLCVTQYSQFQSMFTQSQINEILALMSEL